MTYTDEQVQLIQSVRRKVEALFATYPVAAHGIEHVARVAVYAKKIAIGEKATSQLLCELSGWLHDIGRVPEHYPDDFPAYANKGPHQKMSYLMLQDWFKEDPIFHQLTNEEKLEILYAVNYHWNDEANKYDTAWILRDADKLDAFGEVGITRSEEFFHGDKAKISHDMRLRFQMLYFVKTNTAKKIIKEENKLQPILEFISQTLKSGIEDVSL